jgi:hypothetical protein
MHAPLHKWQWTLRPFSSWHNEQTTPFLQSTVYSTVNMPLMAFLKVITEPFTYIDIYTLSSLHEPSNLPMYLLFHHITLYICSRYEVFISYYSFCIKQQKAPNAFSSCSNEKNFFHNFISDIYKRCKIKVTAKYVLHIACCDSIVSTATRSSEMICGSNPGQMQDFPHPSRPAWSPPSLLYY